MDTLPEALRLADELEKWTMDDFDAAAAELRRLYAENAELREANETFGRRQVWWNDRMFALEQQRDALLEALKLAVRQNEHDMVMTGEECRQCRAAIKAVEEGE